MRRRILVSLLGLALVLPFGWRVTAQSRPPITRADYGQWESVALAGGRAGGSFSPDGRWLAYSVTRTNRNNEVRFLELADKTTKVAPFGGQPVFSSDSKWVGYSLGRSDAETERLRTANRPIQNAFGLLNLVTGDMTTVDGIESFSFSGDGAFVAMKRYAVTSSAASPSNASGASGGPAGGRGARGGNAPAEDPIGTTLTIRQLATGRDTTFGNVSEFEWQDGESTHLLAMTISADGKTGNGVHLFDPATAVLRVLESSPTAYSGLVWRSRSTDLAVLRAKTDARHDDPTYAVLDWSGLGATERLRTYDPTTDPGFPAGKRTVTFRRLSWSDDGSTMFLGVADWSAVAPRPVPAPAGRGAEAGRGDTGSPEADEPAGVDIWHWNDVDVMAKQKLSVTADRRRNLLAAWHLDSGKFVQIGKSFTEQVTPIRHTSSAYVVDWSAYAMERSIGKPAADLVLADLATGARTKLKGHVIDRYAQVSPSGKYLLYLEDDQYWTQNLKTGAEVNITRATQTSFVDKDSDETVKQKPPFGVAGWTKNDAAVLLYDKYDIWQLPSAGTHATRLTYGAADEMRHRLVRVNPDDEFSDLDRSAYLTLFGVRSKKSGYGILRSDRVGADRVDRVVWLDKSVGGLAKAKSADVYAYTAQDFDDSPDIFVGGSDLTSAKAVTSSNSFQTNYAWGRSELVDYKTDKGQKLQAGLYYPAGYEPGKKYPMIVYLYERLSDNVHRYVVPSDREYYNTSVFTSQGYFVLQPDIVFRPRDPGLSVVECVTPAVKRVVQMGVVDGAHIGVVGHSWGGFDTAFLATHTSGVFAAAVAGAPITDLVSNYGNHHWSSGIAETDHIETGQQRMEVPLYDDLPAYVRNSAVFNAQNMTVPLLIEVGDADGTVFWHQGVELYNIARRARKNVVMLVYNGEDHGLRQRKNQVDYQHRILEWFGYYLKGTPAGAWIIDGESALARAQAVKKLP